MSTNHYQIVNLFNIKINAILLYIESTKLVTQNNVWNLGRGWAHYSPIQANNRRL